MKTTDTAEKFVKVTLYGEFGMGKTVTAASYSDNSLIVHTDSGWTSLQNHSLKADLIEYEAVSQLMAFDFEKDEHETIILDTVNEMTEEYLDMLMREASWGGKFREKIITNNPEVKNMENPAPADYQVIRNKFRPALRRFLKAKKDVFLICHENAPIEGLSRDMTKKPSLSDKVFKVIAQDCHVLGRMTRNNKGEFIIDVEGNSLIAAKSRINTIKGKISPDEFIQALKLWKVS